MKQWQNSASFVLLTSLDCLWDSQAGLILAGAGSAFFPFVDGGLFLFIQSRDNSGVRKQGKMAVFDWTPRSCPKGDKDNCVWIITNIFFCYPKVVYTTKVHSFLFLRALVVVSYVWSCHALASVKNVSFVYVRKVSRHEVKKSAWVKRSKVFRFRYCPPLDISTSQEQFVTHFYLVT